MASPTDFIVPPAFSASELLSARKLNTVSHDLGVLYGVNFAPPLVFPGKNYMRGDVSGSEIVFWQGRMYHQFDTLNIKLATKVPAGNTASAVLTIASPDGTDEYVVTSISTGSTSWEYAPSAIDISGLGLTTGCVYVLRAKAKRLSGGDNALYGRVDHIFESAGSSGWTTPPTFVSGSVSAASDLNIWGDGLNWLKDRISQAIPAYTFFETETYDTQPDAKQLFSGYIKHTGCTLLFMWGQKGAEAGTAAGSGEVWLSYNGSVAACTTCDTSDTWKYTTGSYSLEGKGLTLGEYYSIELYARNAVSYGGQVQVRLAYVYEDNIPAPSGWNAPRTYSHGEMATSASMQAISDDLTVLHEERRDIAYAVRDNTGSPWTSTPPEIKMSGIAIIHRAPWLWHLGAGKVIFREESVSFDDPDPDNPGTEWGVINLAEISWLPQGGLYYVVGENLIAAFESYDPV